MLDSASRISLSESPPVSNQVIGRMLKLSPSRSVGEWGPCRILCADAPVSNVETKESESRGRRLRGPRGRLLRRSRSRLGPVACAGAPSPPGRMRDPARARPRPARVSSRGRTRPPGAVRPPSAVGSPPRLIALMAVDRRLDALDVDRGGRAGPVPASPGATRRLEESPACAVSPIPHPPASPHVPDPVLRGAPRGRGLGTGPRVRAGRGGCRECGPVPCCRGAPDRVHCSRQRRFVAWTRLSPVLQGLRLGRERCARAGRARSRSRASHAATGRRWCGRGLGDDEGGKAGHPYGASRAVLDSFLSPRMLGAVRADTRGGAGVVFDARWDGGEIGVVEFPSGARVRGHRVRDFKTMQDFPDLAVMMSGAPPRLDIPSDTRWIQWPDFWLPVRDDEAWAVLREAHSRALFSRVDVACGGGVGRTGTALACIAVLDGVPPSAAVQLIRDRFSRRAVETPWQRRYIKRLAREQLSYPTLSGSFEDSAGDREPGRRGLSDPSPRVAWMSDPEGRGKRCPVRRPAARSAPPGRAPCARPMSR